MQIRPTRGGRLAICLDGTPAAADAVTGPRHPEMCSCAAAAHFCLVAQAHPAVVPHARRSARHTLAAWRLDQIADDTELVVSELLTNAVLLRILRVQNEQEARCCN